MKLLLAYVWLSFLQPVLHYYHEVPMPAGVCAYLPCDFFGYAWVRGLLWYLALVLVVLYIFEFRMRITLFLMALLSLFAFSLEESNGIYNRTAILSALMLAQFLAYVFRRAKGVDPVSFSRQIIAAAYTLACLSKLRQSGFTWAWDAPNLLLQIRKGAYYAYFDGGNTTQLQLAQDMGEFFAAWPALLYGGLLLAFLLELFSFVILINARTAFWYGILLLFMHLGIYLVMDIIIYPIVYPMLVVLLNPLYTLTRLMPATWRAHLGEKRQPHPQA